MVAAQLILAASFLLSADSGEEQVAAARAAAAFYRSVYQDYISRGFSPRYVSARVAYRKWQAAQKRARRFAKKSQADSQPPVIDPEAVFRRRLR